jgi:hypothetical protein
VVVRARRVRVGSVKCIFDVYFVEEGFVFLDSGREDVV